MQPIQYLTASAAAGTAASGLTAALLPPKAAASDWDSDDTDSDDSSDSDASSLPLTDVTPAQKALVGLAVGAGLLIPAAAMATSPALTVFLAGGVCMALAPVVGARQHRIARHKGIHHHVDEVRRNAKDFGDEVRRTQEIVDDLEDDLGCLDQVEEELQRIAENQAIGSAEIMRLVDENDQILQGMKEYLRRMTMTEITRLVMASDRDGDMTIDLRELNGLALRVELALYVRGIEMDGEMFIAMIRKDSSITHVLTVIGAIMFGETIGGKHVHDYAEDACQERARKQRAQKRWKTAVGRIRPRIAVEDTVDGAVQAEKDAKARQRREAQQAAMTAAAAMFTVQKTYVKPKARQLREARRVAMISAGAMFTVQKRYARGSVAAALAGVPLCDVGAFDVGSKFSRLCGEEPGMAPTLKRRQSRKRRGSQGQRGATKFFQSLCASDMKILGKRRSDEGKEQDHSLSNEQKMGCTQSIPSEHDDGPTRSAAIIASGETPAQERRRRREELDHDATTNPDHFVGVPARRRKAAAKPAATGPPICGW